MFKQRTVNAGHVHYYLYYIVNVQEEMQPLIPECKNTEERVAVYSKTNQRHFSYP